MWSRPKVKNVGWGKDSVYTECCHGVAGNAGENGGSLDMVTPLIVTGAPLSISSITTSNMVGHQKFLTQFFLPQEAVYTLVNCQVI